MEGADDAFTLGRAEGFKLGWLDGPPEARSLGDELGGLLGTVLGAAEGTSEDFGLGPAVAGFVVDGTAAVDGMGVGFPVLVVPRLTGMAAG